MDNAHTLHAACAGEIAARVAECETLRVVTAFERSFYVEDSSGRLACFLPEGMESGPLHLLCSGWRMPERLGIVAGMLLVRKGAFLHGPGLVIDLRHSELWRPVPFPPFERALFENGVAHLARSLCRAPAEAFARHLFQDNIVQDGFIRIVFANIEKGCKSLLAWLSCPGEIAQTDAFSLLGLGPGLTPSGDDIIAGVMLTLHHGKRDAGRNLAEALSGPVLEHANRISGAHLFAAMEGQGVEVFHDLLCAVYAGKTEYDPLLERVGKIGHTSGWDAVAGIVLAAHWILGHSYDDAARIASATDAPKFPN